MINLINSEIYKLFKTKAFYICLILCVIFALVSPVIYKVAQDFMDPATKQMIDEMTNSIPISGGNIGLSMSTLQYQGEMTGMWFVGQIFAGNILSTMMGIVIAILVTQEFSNGTIKTIASKGIGRNKIFLSKIVVAIITTVIFFLAVVVTSSLSGAITYGFGAIEQVGGFLTMLAVQLVLHISLASLFTMIAMSIRNTAGSIATSILMVMMFSTLLSLINILFGGNIDLNQYWVLGNIAQVTEVTLGANDVIRANLVAVVYMILSIGIGIRIFKIRDI